MGFAGFDYQGPDEVFDELCELSATYHGVRWEKVEHGEYQWPIPFDGHPGTPRLHEDDFINGRGIFKLIRYRDPAETIDENFPVWLTTGRRLQSYHTRTQTGRSGGIDYLLPEELLEVNPDDVEAWGLEDGGWARMS
ncbi:MAG: molybdopterin dinucleotide binding domain-containing protein, partial [Gemmatimonadota bacterium]